MKLPKILPTAMVGLTLAAAFLAGAGVSRAQDDQAANPCDKEYEADNGPDTIDTSAFPPEQQERYTLFASKCSKCHTLARPINTDKTAEQWARYVRRMSSKPRSNISPDQAKQIYLFLKFYQGLKDSAATGDAATSSGTE